MWRRARRRAWRAGRARPIVRSVTPDSTWPVRPGDRPDLDITNSSRFELTMVRKRRRSSSGVAGFSASASTRRLKPTQAISRLKKLGYFFAVAREGVPTAGWTMTATEGFADFPAVFFFMDWGALSLGRVAGRCRCCDDGVTNVPGETPVCGRAKAGGAGVENGWPACVSFTVFVRIAARVSRKSRVGRT